MNIIGNGKSFAKTSSAARKSFFCWLVIALILVTLSACATATPTKLAPLSATTNTQITLTLWHAQTGVAATTLNALASDFHKAYPNITVRVETKASEIDLVKEGLARLAVNQPPDIVIASTRTSAEFERRGAFIDLDALVNDGKLGFSQEERNDFLPGLIDTGRLPELKNQLMALPFDVNAVVLYYNIDFMRAAKFDAPQTWEQFGNAARATTKGNVRGWAMVPDATIFSALLFSRGGNVLAARDGQTQAQFADDAGLKTMQMITALFKGGAAYFANNTESAQRDFLQGKTALLFGTTDDLTTITDGVADGVKFQWGITNIPQEDLARSATAVFGLGISIFKPVASNTSDERMRAAWLFARWLTMPESSARWSRETLAIPIRASASVLLANNLLPQFQRLRDGLGTSVPTMRALPAVKDANLIDSAIIEAWASMANNVDPATALKNAATRVNRILGQIQ